MRMQVPESISLKPLSSNFESVFPSIFRVIFKALKAFFQTKNLISVIQSLHTYLRSSASTGGPKRTFREGIIKVSMSYIPSSL